MHIKQIFFFFESDKMNQGLKKKKRVARDDFIYCFMLLVLLLFDTIDHTTFVSIYDNATGT